MVVRHLQAVIVNYATADLTRMAVWSLRSAYPELQITVVENGSPDDSLRHLRVLREEASLLRLIELDSNLHHGPAMDLGIRDNEAEWVLLFDSDCILFRSGLLEGLLERALLADAYMVGEVVQVDERGYGGAGGKHRYVHPKCALVRRSIYLDLPPFRKHGVPCLENELEAAARGFSLMDWPVRDYVYHIGRGTAGRHGYGLGLRGRLYQLRHLIQRR